MKYIVIPAKAGIQSFIVVAFLAALLSLNVCVSARAETPEVIKAGLAQSASDPDPAVRQAAARGLGETRNRDAVPLLAKMLATDGDETVRLTALGALETIGDGSAVPSYVRALKDESELVRRSAAEALTGVRDRASQEALVEALGKDPSFKVRQSAAEALVDVSGDGATGDLRGRDEEADTESALIRALKDDESYQVRATAAEVLGRYKDGKAVDPLVEAMDDKSSQVRAAAAESLGNFDSRKGIDRLVDALSFERDDAVLVSALRSLKYSGDPRVIDPAIKALKSGSSRVRWTAIDVLEALRSPDSVEPLKTVEHDSYESEGVREKAKEALQLMGAE